MKRLTLFIVLACLGQAMQAQETQEAQAEEMPEKVCFEFWYDVTNDKTYTYYHYNEECPTLDDPNKQYEILPSLCVEQLSSIKPCPYCVLHEPYPYKKKKSYWTIAKNYINISNITHNKHQHYQSTNAYDRIETADSSVTIEIIHEILNRQRIKEIKDAHVAEVMNTIAAVASIATSALAFSNHQYPLAAASTFNVTASGINAAYLNNHTKMVEDLDILVRFTNVSKYEIQINNENQGRVWHLLPGQSIDFGDYSLFTDAIRVETLLPAPHKVTYYNFDVKNHLIRVKPLERNEQEMIFDSRPLETETQHYLDLDTKQDSIQYRLDMVTGAFNRVEE